MDKQSNTLLVTIAIPAYKTDFLAETISSALSQTYDNIEVVVVDDASPNDVQGVVAGFSDCRLSYHRNEKNLGKDDPSRNWNECLKYAKGEFICILCDDDIYHPEFVSELMELAGKHETCNAFRSGVKQIDSFGNTTEYYPLAPEHEGIEEYIWHLHSGNNRQTMSEWMFRTPALREMGGYVAAPMAWGADCSTVYCMARNGGVVSSPRRLMCFRKSEINITGSVNYYNRQKIEGWRKQCELAKEIIMNSNSEACDMIVGVVNRDERRWTKMLAYHATIKELLCMYMQRERYGVNLGILLVGIWKNLTHPFRHL